MPGWIGLLREYIGEDDIKRVVAADEQGKRPIDYILDNHLVNPQLLLSVLSSHWGLPSVELAEYEPDHAVVELIAEESARRFGMLPLFKLEDRLYAALSEPDNLMARDYLRRQTGLTVEPVLALPADIEQAITRNYVTREKTARTMDSYKEIRKQDTVPVKDELVVEDREAPAVKLVGVILNQAVNLGASDIHLESFAERAMLRYRIDGVLHEFPPPPAHLMRALVTRIKILSNLDMAERRRVQDGRATWEVEGRKFDLRVSIIPGLHGESVVIRVLDSGGKKKKLEELGFARPMFEHYTQLIKRPYGILLVTGPTGSGKTTTLYATLQYIYTPRKKIITLEDPVEYQMEGITQFQVNADADFTFAAGLRGILRHDPDIVLVGEIRDLETAEIAIRSSLTGHMVFSTLHTNDAPSAVTRLIDMGIAPYLVFSSLAGVIAQRLIRVLCPECKRPFSPDQSQLLQLKIESLPAGARIFEPVGCAACNNLGYRGRMAIYELMDIPARMRQMDPGEITPGKVRELAVGAGLVTLRQSALEKLYAGVTGIEEVLGLTIEEE